MSKIAIIPARGGSKRIPGKNIRPFYGRPIIAYSIELAINSNLFDEVMVSTDDQEIAQVSKQYGASVPFLRSRKNSDDLATTADVLLEVLDEYRNNGASFETACCLYPTAPLVSISRLLEAYDLLVKERLETVFPVVEYSYPIWRSLKFSDNKIKMNWPEHEITRSQDLEKTYHDAGQFYWLDVESFIKKKTLFTNNSGALVLDDMEAQDIDNFSDWKLAELKYQLKENK